MSKPKSKVFRCFDNGVFLMEGTAMEIGKVVDIPYLDTIYTYARTGSRYHRRYTFVATGKTKRNAFKKDMVAEQPKPKSEHEQTLEYLAWHLNKYGNTTLKGKPSEFEEELKAMGIEFTYRKYDKKDYILECY